ncbi:MAG: efflux RND transporter periplasmic adaptor subunit [Mesorhizobium sp.]
MDQIVKRPQAEETAAVETTLALDKLDPARGRSLRWRYILAALLAAAVLAAVYLWFGQSAPNVTYTTAPLESGDLTVEVSATGTLQPLTQVDISSELSGVVRSVAVNENQDVGKGDVLAVLDTTRLSAQIERAEASAKAAEAKVTDTATTLKETEQALTRARQLSSQRLVADQALEMATAARDRAASAVAMAEANLAIAAAELKLQQADLEKSTIYAPIDGIVLTRSVAPGQTVASSLQAPVLFVIAADLRKMELKAAIDEADIGGVKPGQTARFTVDAFPDRRFDAKIRDIAFASVTTEGVVTYDARLDVDNAELLLRPGMTATVAVITREADGILTVPSSAFRFQPPVARERSGWSLQNLFMPRMGRGGGQRQQRAAAQDGVRTLYILENGAPKAVQVKPGSTDGEKVEVLSGLKQGDLVITAATRAE